MITAEIKGDIVDNQTRDLFKMFGCEDQLFSSDVVKNVFKENESETQFKFNIDTNGGFVDMAFNAYDIIRTSGKEIFTNVMENCHSSGLILLLSAPKENRTANRNAHFLIHLPRVTPNESMTADELRQNAESLDLCKKKILNLYAERTGTDIAVLENLMNEEKIRTADEMLQYGFIGKINNYNTNLKNDKMTQITKELQAILDSSKNAIAKIKNLLEPTKAVNYAFTDHEGNVLFNTEKEDDSIAVGDKASPDGTFEVNNQIVIIENGVITSIEPAQYDNEEINALKSENEALKIELNALKESQNSLNDKIGQMTNVLKENETVINKLSSELKSNYQVPGRLPNQKPVNQEKTAEQTKAELKEKYKQLKSK